MKVRQNLYIDREISDALEALAAGPGTNKSHLVCDALADWLRRRGMREVDDLLKARLDRLSRDIQLIRRDIGIVLESLALFIQFQLTVTAPLAAGDEAGRAIGRARFEEFLRRVAAQLASGKRTLGETSDAGALS